MSTGFVGGTRSCCSQLVALDSSHEALSSYTLRGGCSWLERDREVAVSGRVFVRAGLKKISRDPCCGNRCTELRYGLSLLQREMPPRRRGRGRGQFEESTGQNEDRRSARSHTRVSNKEEDEIAAPPTERMDVVIARFQRMNPPAFNGDESSEDANSWLFNIIGLFDRVQYDDDLRLICAIYAVSVLFCLILLSVFVDAA
ncbi:hypothetical protein F511_24030 [Dorcoceras hygrometricum]|uniref:Uncharacterized protein n=1 Tax=Dorcoceras hygrometricum TaxID=472368 RepID=A0A2Z7BTP8_9LAMI|nr:hypothetical protein F511_24030 [Dorcoceras hygrometricum]